MMSTIRSRIFFPVVFLIILFPILSWMLFTATSDWYMDRIARQSLGQLMDSVHDMAGEVYESDQPGPLSREEEKRYSRELLRQVKGYMRKDRPQARLLALNSRMKLTFPKEADYQEDTAVVYEACKDMIAGTTQEQGHDDMIAGTTQDQGHEDMIAGITEQGHEGVPLSVGSRNYLLSIFETGSTGNIRGKYLVGYVEVPDTEALLSYTGGLLLIIASSLAALSLVGAWLIACSISRPLQALCRQAQTIGKGGFTPSRTSYPVAEIESLKEALNGMAGELEQAQQQQMAFFQNASHELRTPLMSICGYAQGIQCNVFPDHSQAASVILSETMRMKELVDGILTISRLDSHEFEMRTAEVSLGDFVVEQLDLLRGIEMTENVSLDFVSQPEYPIKVMADASLLSRAFRNVVSDCARYARSRVTVFLEEEGEWYVLRVEDDGPGLSEKEMPHVFERFYKGSQGNYGIGLSITRSSMEYMGGRAEVRNRQPPFTGAVFRLMFPVHCPEHVSSAKKC